MSALDLIGIGECMVEFRPEALAGRTDLMRMAWGGDVMNSLVHAARLGLRVGFQSRIGNDAFGDWLREGWMTEGIDLTHAPLVDGENGIYFITNDAAGERRFSYRRAGSAASRMEPGDLDAAWLGTARFVLLSGITQAISTSAAALNKAAAQATPRAVYDPNHRPNLWAERGGIAAARQAFAEVARLAAWLLPSYPDDAVLLAHPAGSPQEALAGFAAAGSGQVAMKIGPEGVLIRTEGQTRHIPGAQTGPIVDTTGAGDSWNAAFLAALCGGADPAAAARSANHHAVKTLAYPGAVPPRG
ncbi:MAG: sugar kinase [Pseudomonadota bacterium]